MAITGLKYIVSTLIQTAVSEGINGIKEMDFKSLFLEDGRIVTPYLIFFVVMIITANIKTKRKFRAEPFIENPNIMFKYRKYKNPNEFSIEDKVKLGVLECNLEKYDLKKNYVDGFLFLFTGLKDLIVCNKKLEELKSEDELDYTEYLKKIFRRRKVELHK